MKQVWYLLYNVFIIPILRTVLFLGQFINPKIRTGIEGRKKLVENLIIDLAGIDRSKKMIWFHSSSMGEFEQAKPIIEKLRSSKKVNIIITFFSPSGYTNSLKYPHADIIAYFPYDTPGTTARFLNLVRPNLAVFMRYDIWPNMIWQLEKKRIPSFIVDATMRSKTPRKWVLSKSFHKSLYSHVTRILAVSEEDELNFREFDVKREIIKAVGDTRFDRVYQKSINAKDKKLFKDGFFNGKKVFVLGSSWESDHEVMIPALLKLMKYDLNVITVIVPHEPTILHLEEIENSIAGSFKSIRFSYLNNYKDERVIVIDSIGVLLTLYTYAHAAYVGGSFKQGIHNVLEPAVYGIPVLFGPRHENSQEAIQLYKIGGGICVRNKKEAYRKLRKIFSDDELRKKLGKISFDYVRENVGATSRILAEFDKFI
ncbi:MAG: 3-deoxy-D-manno-octulosonic acid transferase [Ignavibacteriae bacterium HGW-Ignavibacteriae-3]|nr:MAG: 3-deoxy-D-manno-octulosonic acid transferase [Ignavibacteriae bacterium HGW-Ignavibacteriae-3]